MVFFMCNLFFSKLLDGSSGVNVCSQVFLPFRSYVNVMMALTLSMWLTHYDHQLNAIHEFNLLLKHNGKIIDLLFIYLEHKLKKILVLSLNWKVNFKLFNPEMGQN